MPVEKKNLIQTLDRAIDILEVIESSPEPMRVSDIAAQLRLCIQTTGNLLRVMYYRGLVSQDCRRRYLLGPLCYQLGCAADRWIDLRTAGATVMEELMQKWQCTVYLGVIENDRLLNVLEYPVCRRPGGMPSQRLAGQLHCTACGKILLAYLEDDERTKLFARTNRRQITEKTITDISRLENNLAEIRRSGYALAVGESVLGTVSLAVPVFRTAKPGIAGLSIAVRCDDNGDSLLPRLKELRIAAARIGGAA